MPSRRAPGKRPGAKKVDTGATTAEQLKALRDHVQKQKQKDAMRRRMIAQEKSAMAKLPDDFMDLEHDEM